VKRVKDSYTQLLADASASGTSAEEEMQKRGYGDYAAFSAQCPQFPLTCRPIDFSEVGSGFVLYFHFLRFLMYVLLILLFIQIPVMHLFAQADGLIDWNWSAGGFTTDELDACKCIGQNHGVGGLNPESGLPNRSDYGASCGAWDLDACEAGASPPSEPSQRGRWCCRSWCFASPKCPVTNDRSVPSLSNRRLSDADKRAYGLSDADVLVKSYSNCAQDESLAAQNCSAGHLATERAFSTTTFDNDAMIWSETLTPGNLGPDAGEEQTILVCHIASVAVLGFLVVFQAQYQRRVDSKVDKDILSPDDFAILIDGLPRDATDEEVIKQFFAENAVKGKTNTEIVKVVIGWDGKSFNCMTNQIKKKQSEANKIRKKDGRRASALEEDIAGIKTEFHKALIGNDSQLAGSGLAVVVFRYSQDQRDCLDRWSTWMAQWFNRETVCWCCRGPRLPMFPEHGTPTHALQVSRADSPGNINWQDFGRKQQTKYWLFGATNVCMFALVCVSFAIVYGFTKLQELAKDERFDPRTGSWEVKGSIFLSLLPAMGVGLVNFLVVVCARIFGEKECHYTFTSEAASQTFKMTLAMVVNTAGLLLFLNAQPKEWYSRGGLVEDMFFMLVLNALVPPLMIASDYEYFQKWWNQRQVSPEKLADLNNALKAFRDNKDVSLRKAAMRAECEVRLLEKHFEPSEMDIPRHYANALKTFLCPVLYMPLMPLGLLTGLFGLMFQYWVDKYMLLRYCRRPSATHNATHAKSCLSYVRYVGLLGIPIALQVFLRPSWRSKTQVNGAMFLSLCASLLCCIFPLTVLRFLCGVRFCLWQSGGSNTPDDYYQAQRTWPKEMKYHKSQFLYKCLTEEANPEYLNPDISATFKRGDFHTSSFLQQSASSTGLSAASVVLENTATQQSQSSRPPSTTTASLLGNPGSACILASLPVTSKPQYVPGVVLDAPSQPSQTCFSWESQGKGGGFVPMHADCLGQIEAGYLQAFEAGGAKRVMVQTQGQELSVDFEKMTSYVKGSGVRSIRRRELG